MEKAEIQRIREYAIELEEGLYEWDYRGLPTLGNLTELYRIIEQLMEATSKEQDENRRILLAALEYKARKCKECIERRLVERRNGWPSGSCYRGNWRGVIVDDGK